MSHLFIYFYLFFKSCIMMLLLSLCYYWVRLRYDVISVSTKTVLQLLSWRLKWVFRRVRTRQYISLNHSVSTTSQYLERGELEFYINITQDREYFILFYWKILWLNPMFSGIPGYNMSLLYTPGKYWELPIHLWYH